VQRRYGDAALAHWLEEPLPVVLVLYDARQDVGYWLYLQQYFANRPKADMAAGAKRVTVSIPSGNLLDRKAMKALARAKNAAARSYRRSWTHAL